MKISLKIQQLSPDKSNYKSYGILIEPIDVYVEVDVPDKYIAIDLEGQPYILTEDGMKWLMCRMARLTSEAEDEYARSVQSKQ